jgi:flagellar FliL protein
MADAKDKDPKSAGSGSGKKIVIGAVAVLLLIAIGAGGYLLGHRAAPATAGTAEAAHAVVETAKSADPIYLALDPPFIVNFQDAAAMRFLQVGVQLMAHDQHALDAAKASEPAVRNALVMLFSSQDAKSLSSRDGKEKLRADALAELQKIIGERSKGAAIDAVYFTSFVMQ